MSKNYSIYLKDIKNAITSIEYFIENMNFAHLKAMIKRRVLLFENLKLLEKQLKKYLPSSLKNILTYHGRISRE